MVLSNNHSLISNITCKNSIRMNYMNSSIHRLSQDRAWTPTSTGCPKTGPGLQHQLVVPRQDLDSNINRLSQDRTWTPTSTGCPKTGSGLQHQQVVPRQDLDSNINRLSQDRTWTPTSTGCPKTGSGFPTPCGVFFLCLIA